MLPILLHVNVFQINPLFQLLHSHPDWTTMLFQSMYETAIKMENVIVLFLGGSWRGEGLRGFGGLFTHRGGLKGGTPLVAIIS